jgi:hypothetical protein
MSTAARLITGAENLRRKYRGTSPTGRLLHIAVLVVDYVIVTGKCLVCGKANFHVDHERWCPIEPAVRETTAARRVTKVDEHGNERKDRHG